MLSGLFFQENGRKKTVDDEHEKLKRGEEIVSLDEVVDCENRPDSRHICIQNDLHLTP